MPTELFEDFFWALADHARAEPAPGRAARPQRAPHRRDAVQGDRPRALDGGGHRPARQGHPQHEGLAVIAVLDYGIGNLGSVLNALRRVGAEAELVTTPAAARDARVLVVPGDGAFAATMHEIESRGFGDLIRRAAADGRDVLGICIGMQILFDESEEHGRPSRPRSAPGPRAPDRDVAAGAAHGLEPPAPAPPSPVLRRRAGRRARVLRPFVPVRGGLPGRGARLDRLRRRGGRGGGPRVGAGRAVPPGEVADRRPAPACATTSRPSARRWARDRPARRRRARRPGRPPAARVRRTARPSTAPIPRRPRAAGRPRVRNGSTWSTSTRRWAGHRRSTPSPR